MNFNAPINSVSFGNVTYNILKSLLGKTEASSVNIFPIGNVDFSVYDEDKVFTDKILSSASVALERFSRTDPSFKLWHIGGSESSISSGKRALMTFHETSELTRTEKNILDQQDLIFVSSSYTKSVFESFGVKNVFHVPLGFDSTHFKTVEIPQDDTIRFLLAGKSENRKNTLRLLNLWAQKYGNDKRYNLLCQINNPFTPPEVFKNQIRHALGGKHFFNISFLDFIPKLSTFNQLLNAIDIDLTGMSACEGFNLPAFHTTALGKWGIFLNAHVHKDFADESNAILVNPTGMRPAEDIQFFRKGDRFNQGEWFEFNNDDFISAMEIAVSKAKTLNENGLKLQEKFTYDKTTESILSLISGV